MSADMVERLTAAEAAVAIVALINSRPTSPWLGEIQAVIERVCADAELAGSSILAMQVPHVVPVDVELVRLISAWREQRDIIDRTAVETAGILTDAESKPSEEITGKAIETACDLAKQIWERAKAETWSGGPVNLLTLAVLAEIVLHHENGASNTLNDGEEYYMDQRATAELMVAVMSYARSAGALSDLLPMEGRFLPPALLKGGRRHG
jgi:hypothetical protein